MATFQDTFNRADSTTVGNGWTEDELAAGDARILSAALEFPNTVDAADINRARDGGFGRADTTVLFEFQHNGNLDHNAVFSVSYLNASRNASQGLFIAINGNGGIPTVAIRDDATTKGSFSPTIAASTWYKFRVDIAADFTTRVYMSTGTITSADLKLTVPAFTPASSDGGRWAFGNVDGARFRNLTIYDSYQTDLLAPEVETDAVTDLDALSVTANGEVVTDNGLTISERGFVYGTAPAPTTADTKATVAGTVGTYSKSLTGLTAGTTYYVRAYAINAGGTSYGADVSFTTTTAPARTVYKDISGISGGTYAVRLTVGGTVGTLTVQLGSTGTSQVIAAGAGIYTFTGTYGGLNGLTLFASADFNGTIDDVAYVFVPSGASVNDIDWTLDLFTAGIAINSSVLFRRVEASSFNRFRIYRYLDLLLKNLSGYVTVSAREEANAGVATKSTEFQIEGTVGDVSPFVKKRISFLSKAQSVLVGLSNNRKDDAFTVAAYELSGTEQPKRQFAASEISSMS